MHTRTTLQAGAIGLALVAVTWAVDWPQWRGVGRDGISTEKGLLKEWPEGGPKLVWKTQGLSDGFAGLAIVKGRIYTQGQRGDHEFVMAFDAASGKKLWETAHGGSFRESRGHGPRGTPTVDGDVLYAMTADGVLSCLKIADGSKVWSLNVTQKFGGGIPHWGYSESPLVDGDRLIATPGGSDGAVVALNKKTGATLWKSQSDPAGYSSIIAVNYNGVRQYVGLTANGAVGLMANTGELLWRYSKIANNVANIATPIFNDGLIFVSTDYGTGCALLKLDQKGAATEVYFNRDMKNHYSTSVLIGDTLYGFSSAVLTAMDFRTGKVLWRDRSVGKGSVTYADGNLYVFGEDGVMGLVEASPDSYKEKGRFRIARGNFNTWTPPVISDGKLFLREQDNLYCYDVKGR